MDNLPRISEYFKEKNVLITGATGFIGKVLVEKLLRSCSDLKAIYVLIRSKRGHTVKARLSSLFDSRAFDHLRTRKDLLKKVVAVEGDVSKPLMGLSQEDQRALENDVNIVFHCAATIKFEETLRIAVTLNVSGTKSLLELSKRMKHLESFVHVSTAYCNCQLIEVIQERLYPTSIDPEKMLQLIDILDDASLEKIAPMLIDKRPNSYTFTKSQSEHVLNREKGRLPIAVVRPSIVAASWMEPQPGWVENLNGLTGVMTACMKGLLSSIICRQEYVADIIPVDLTINLLIAVAWITGVNKSNGIKFYNHSSGTDNPITWNEIKEYSIPAMRKYPCKYVLFKPWMTFTTNDLLHNLHMFLFHEIPAYLVDTTARLTGRKPKLVRIQEKLNKGMKVVEFFRVREFFFDSTSTNQLSKNLIPEDRNDFEFDVTVVKWNVYLQNMVLGIRKFFLKEDPVDATNLKVWPYWRVM